MVNRFPVVFAMLAFVYSVCFGSGSEMSVSADQAPSVKPRILLLTGESNHDWQRTSRMLRALLEESELFDVHMWLGPGLATPPDQIEAPDFGEYSVVLWDYNPRDWSRPETFEDNYQWPETLRMAWIQYIEGGGRALLIHSSNNPFPGWVEFERMVGLLWRGACCGCAVQFDREGIRLETPAGEGSGAGHGRLHDFRITHREPDHPVLAGLPKVWLHSFDELYHRQRGPCPEEMTVLATAWNDKSIGGTDRYEPVLWEVPYGDGLVMTWLPGHLWRGQEDVSAFQCVGFRTIVLRSLEYLARGKVTQPVPEDFPTAERVSLRRAGPGRDGGAPR